jgi:hypothetical protein
MSDKMPYVSPEEMILDEDIEDYENYEDNEDDIVMLDTKIKAKANDVFERILESYGYNNTEFTEDELTAIKYKIYQIFLYIPDNAKKTEEIKKVIKTHKDNYIFFEETYMKKVITKIEEKYKDNLIKNIKTVLYDTENVTEDNDPIIINPKQKTVKDVNTYFRDFLKKNIIAVTDSDEKVDIEYDTKDFLDVSKISNIEAVASFINKTEYRLFAFLQYIYNIDKYNTKFIDSYWYWFLKQHIKKFVEKDKPINTDLTWYDTNFYIYDYTKDNKNKVDKKDGIRKFINAISVFEFGTLLLSRYHITDNTNNPVKGFSEKDKKYLKLLTIDEKTLDIVKPVKADEDSTKIIYGLRPTSHTFLSDKAENEKGRKRFKIKLYASLKIYDKY